MTEAQAIIADLEARDWTLAAMADSIGVSHSTVEKWKAGKRNPANPSILVLLTLKNKKPPKKRRYGPKL
jgi:transcriptional regulator with XRE-family HTH domain